MTLYIGGSSDYWEDVDGTHLPDADSGIPAPHFYVESSEIPAEHLAGVTFHGTGADGTEKSWKLAPYGRRRGPAGHRRGRPKGVGYRLGGPLHRRRCLLPLLCG